MQLIIPGLFGIIGILIGIFVSWFLARSAQKLSNAFEFHREFFSLKMLESRTKADKILMNHKGVDFTTLYKELDTEEMNHIWNIIEFYERLYVSIRYKQVDENIVSDLFGGTYFYWYLIYFKDGFQDRKWHSKRRIDNLYKWFIKKTDKKIIQEWEDRAFKEYDDISHIELNDD